MKTESLIQLLSILTGILIPFIQSKITTVKWTSTQKWLLFVGLAAVGGFLNVAIEGKLNWENLMETILTVFIAGQTFFNTIFKNSGLEAILNPKEGVVTDAVKQVKEQVSELQNSTARKINDKTDTTTLTVDTTVKK